MKKFHTIKDKRIEAKKAIPKIEMDARKRFDPRTSMAGAMMALSGGPPLDAPSGRTRPGRSGGVCLWEASPYNAGSYPTGYSNQANCKSRMTIESLANLYKSRLNADHLSPLYSGQLSTSLSFTFRSLWLQQLDNAWQRRRPRRKPLRVQGGS